jgi:hypothetical protein
VDLAEPHFTEPLCQSFRGNVAALSKQKFSSNVIEKCIRTADFQVRRLLIEEMLVSSELEKMLRDSFANYVVQTAMDFADPETRTKLTEAIRPILPTIRQTPHGRRIAGKMISAETQGRVSGGSSGHITPNDMTNDQKSLYHQIHSFPNSVITQYTQPLAYPPENQSTNSSIPVSASEMMQNASPVASSSDSGTTIYSPVPQPISNGINGSQAQGFPFY